jgi:uncharacterized protein (TIGR02145 family)
MRKSIAVLKAFILFILLYGCSTTPNNTGGDNSTSIPVSPSNLTGNSVSLNQVDLSWTDNSTNETGFKIERRLDGGTFAVVGTVGENIYTFSDMTVTPRTIYTYRVYSYNAVGNSPTYSNEFIVQTGNTPIINTMNAMGVGSNSLVSGGNVVDSGLGSIIEKGVVWNTISGPTIILTTRTQNGSGNNSYLSQVTGLLPNTTYHIRAYARNSYGTGYGNEITINTPALLTDIDGNQYPTFIENCSGKLWTQTNVNVSRYNNGDIIPQVIADVNFDIPLLSTGYWCWMGDGNRTDSSYGKLYNNSALTDLRRLAPQGWHIATNSDWLRLIKCIDPNLDTTFNSITYDNGGYELTEAGISHWPAPNDLATNTSGFKALPSGYFQTSGFGDWKYGVPSYWTDISGTITLLTQARIMTFFSSTITSTRSQARSVRLVKD